MQTDQLSTDTLRRLSEARPPHGRVVSVFLNLDPSEFATGQARSSAISSLVDEAKRRAKEVDGLSHEERTALEHDVERVGAFLRDDLSAEGAHGLTVFCSTPAGLFEAIKLPRAVESAVVIAHTPFVEPLAAMVERERWCVLLVNRRAGRLLEGGTEVLAEIASFRDEVHGQHDQGGWSQPRYERSVEQDVVEHLKRTSDRLFDHFRRTPFDRLLIGAPPELRHDMENRLHASVRERLAGFVDVDVEHASPDDVHRAALPTIEEEGRRREREAIERLVEGVRTGGRGAAGVDEVLGALNERRVEILLLEEGFRAPGSVCARCGWTGAVEGGSCPVDGAELEPRDDVVEGAIELALQQAAEVRVVRSGDQLGPLGSIGAVLRF